MSPIPTDELHAEAQSTADAGLDELPRSLDSETCVVAASSPARGLHELAEETGAAVVVVGSSHRGALGRVLAGTAAAQLLSGSPCPVAVAPRGLADRAPVGLGRIGVGFDDGAESWNALRCAASLAAAVGGAVRVIHAVPPLVMVPMVPMAPVVLPTELEPARRRASELATARAVASLSEEVTPDARSAVGDPVSVLEAEARGDIDLLVLGSRGFGPVRAVLLGSVSSELMRQARCPVMVVPRSASGEAFSPR